MLSSQTPNSRCRCFWKSDVVSTTVLFCVTRIDSAIAAFHSLTASNSKSGAYASNRYNPVPVSLPYFLPLSHQCKLHCPAFKGGWENKCLGFLASIVEGGFASQSERFQNIGNGRGSCDLCLSFWHKILPKIHCIAKILKIKYLYWSLGSLSLMPSVGHECDIIWLRSLRAKLGYRVKRQTKHWNIVAL